MSELLERKKMPTIDDNQFDIIMYSRLLSDYNDIIDSYNYIQRSIDDKSNTIRELRQYISDKDKTVKTIHKLLMQVTNEISSRFRKKEFKSVTWYNDILNEYRELGVDIIPIKTEDMYSAKAVVTIDGMYRNSERDLDSIRLDIINSIRNNITDFKVDIHHVIIEDVYDVEELSESMEG